MWFAWALINTLEKNSHSRERPCAHRLSSHLFYSLSFGSYVINQGLPRDLSGKKKKIHVPTQHTWVRSLAREDPLQEERTTHSVILAWEVAWTEEPGGLQSMGHRRVGHNLATKQQQTTTAINQLVKESRSIKPSLPFSYKAERHGYFTRSD